MLYGTYHGLLSVWMFLEKMIVKGLNEFPERIIHGPVLFFIDRFKLRLKKTKDRVNEPVAIDLEPFIYLVPRELIEIKDPITISSRI